MTRPSSSDRFPVLWNPWFAIGSAGAAIGRAGSARSGADPGLLIIQARVETAPLRCPHPVDPRTVPGSVKGEYAARIADS